MKKALSDDHIRELISFREKATLDENQRIYDAQTIGEQIGEQRGIQIGEKRGIQIGEQIGEQRGEQRGIQIGDLEARLLIAKNLLDKGYSIKEVVDITGLKQTQIEQLLLKNN